MKNIFLRVYIILFGVWCYAGQDILEKEIVIVIPSYNNCKYYQKNLDCVYAQNYENYRVIYIDDCSSDGTGNLVEDYIKQWGQERRTVLIKNKKRLGAPMGNIYKAIHSCDDHVIIVTLDGDDWFAHENVLAVINKQYTENDIWLTYGQFIYWPDGSASPYRELPKSVINKNAYRQFDWTTSHLRTFYAWLFKKIKYEDLLYKNQFFPFAGDLGFMFPMLEMAGHHSKFIPEVLYIYNSANPLNEHKVKPEAQKALARFIRSKRRYLVLKRAPNHVSEKKKSG